MPSTGGCGQLTQTGWLVMVREAEETSNKTKRGSKRVPWQLLTGLFLCPLQGSVATGRTTSLWHRVRLSTASTKNKCMGCRTSPGTRPRETAALTASLTLSPALAWPLMTPTQDPHNKPVTPATPSSVLNLREQSGGAGRQSIQPHTTQTECICAAEASMTHVSPHAWEVEAVGLQIHVKPGLLSDHVTATTQTTRVWGIQH